VKLPQASKVRDHKTAATDLAKWPSVGEGVSDTLGGRLLQAVRQNRKTTNLRLKIFYGFVMPAAIFPWLGDTCYGL
jgi:hypothetical protein